MVTMGLQMCSHLRAVVTTKEVAGEADRDDMRQIWNSLSMYWLMVGVGDEDEVLHEEFFYKHEEDAWGRLEAALDMSLGEWIRQAEEVDEEEEEEVEGEEEQGYEEGEEEDGQDGEAGDQ